MSMVVTVTVWKTEDRGWVARDGSYGIYAAGGATAREAADCVVGSVYAAVALQEHPPRDVKFEVVLDDMAQCCERDHDFDGNCDVHREHGDVGRA